MMPEEAHVMPSPTLTCDREANALYIRFSTNPIEETVALAGNVYLDIDADGQAVGFEVLNADAALLASIPALPGTGMLADLLKPPAA